MPKRSDLNSSGWSLTEAVNDLNYPTPEHYVGDALSGSDDGELFFQNSESESFAFEDGRLKSAQFNQRKGFGLRAVRGEQVGYAHSSDVSARALKVAARSVKALAESDRQAKVAATPQKTNQSLYDSQADPVGSPDYGVKINTLREIDAYARKTEPGLHQVSVDFSAARTQIEIWRPGGERIVDIRPQSSVRCMITLARNGRLECGMSAFGGRVPFETWLDESDWKSMVDEALRQARIKLEAIPAPAGEFDVVLGPGWAGVMLHEAVGHGLEGDANHRKTSAFADRMGEMVASADVTVVDQGNISDRRGTLNIDDEGTPTQETVLIENGRLVNYMHDRMSARLMNVSCTGNGRRESFEHAPMPRMTNTYMRAGSCDPAEIIGSLKKGIYLKSFGGGQVDTASGKFVFESTEANMIENGKIGAPLRGALLIGNGPEAMKRVRMLGNDFALDPGIGMCGKAGQWVPVGVGQPTVRIDGLTIGGTESTPAGR